MQVLALPLHRIIILLTTLSLIFALAYPVWAQDSTPGATRRNQARERVDVIKERMATKEAALKERLAKFRDQKKAEITERISNNLNRINKNMTDRMLKFLDNASRILSKLEQRVNTGSSDVKDVEAAKGAISEAKAAVDSARAAVSAQAEKDYTVTVSSEGRVRTDVKKVRDQLHTDLKTVREAVIKAKQAVANAIRVAKSGKIEVPREGTPSGT